MSAIAIRVLSSSSGDGKASAKAGIFPSTILGEAEIPGDTSTTGAMEVLLRRAEQIALDRAREAVAQARG